MADAITETTTTSWGDRIKGSLCQVCLSPLLLIGAIVLLVWNEGNAVNQYRAFQEGRGLVTTDVPTTSVDPSLDGKLVHVTGIASTNSAVLDPIFGVGSSGGSSTTSSSSGNSTTSTTTSNNKNFLMLQRNVQMYQWTESTSSTTKKNVGGSTTTETTYSYSKAWKSFHVPSSGFHSQISLDGTNTPHTNPDQLLYPYAEFLADDVNIGALGLSETIVGRMTYWRDLAANELVPVASIPDATTRQKAELVGNEYYFGEGTTSAPEVGDTRVGFAAVPGQTVSIVAQQKNGELVSFTTSKGRSILLVSRGSLGAGAMFDRAQAGLTVQTWLLRLLGLVMVYGSFYLAFQPLSVVADVVPCVGNIVEMGNCCVSSILSGVVTTLVIAIAWVANRPLFLLIPLAAIVIGVVACCACGACKVCGGGGDDDEEGNDNENKWEGSVDDFEKKEQEDEDGVVIEEYEGKDDDNV